MASMARLAFSGISATTSAPTWIPVLLNVGLDARVLHRRDAGERRGLEVECAVFLQERDHAVGGARIDFEMALAVRSPGGREFQVDLLFPNPVKAVGLRGAAPARNHAECPAFSER